MSCRARPRFRQRRRFVPRALPTLILALVLGAAGPVAPLASGHGTGHVTEDSKVFFTAPFLQVPIAPTAPTIDGVVGPSEWPAYSAQELPDGGRLRVAHNDSMIFVALDYPGTGWAAVAWSGLGQGPVQVVSAAVQNGTLKTSDAFAGNLTVEFHTEPDTQLGGAEDVRESAAAQNSGRTTVELAVPLETTDTFDPPLEAGEIHTFIAAFNQTDAKTPHTLAEGTQVIFRVFLDRPDDNPAEIASLFAESVSPVPAIVAVAVLVGSAAFIGLPMVRRRVA